MVGFRSSRVIFVFLYESRHVSLPFGINWMVAGQSASEKRSLIQLRLFYLRKWWALILSIFFLLLVSNSSMNSFVKNRRQSNSGAGVATTS